ncbi:MAG TPA: hypothetical protein VE548_11170 [Nitrososphaeraceae archaeon]|jgi:hypothetical protein|nr:hypothetical protein [Nitrososphaeraceae archaeon]
MGKHRIVKGYSVTPDNLNIEYYKEFLSLKLRDTLNLAGFSVSPYDQLQGVFIWTLPLHPKLFQ